MAANTAGVEEGIDWAAHPCGDEGSVLVRLRFNGFLAPVEQYDDNQVGLYSCTHARDQLRLGAVHMCLQVFSLLTVRRAAASPNSVTPLPTSRCSTSGKTRG
eukprot:COSAG02_NODE_11616_length_1688_cov_5.059157_1_plen_102_part_00